MYQIDKIEEPISKIVIIVDPDFPNKGWFHPEEKDYIYVRTEIEYLLELRRYYYQIVDPQTILVSKLNEQQIKDLQVSFSGRKSSLQWIAPWSAINIK